MTSRYAKEPSGAGGKGSLKIHRSRQQEEQLKEEAWESFVTYLRSRDDRVTTARRIVFERVFERHDHFRADELATDLSTGPDRVSRGTIYRTLALMVDSGLVREVRDSDIHVHYEHVYGHDPHEHMICSRCGRFIEFTLPEIQKLVEQACREHGFVETSHRLSVFGQCRACIEASPAEDTEAETQGEADTDVEPAADTSFQSDSES